MGTPVYMSPEQCRGISDIDHRSDIYTMGCVLFTMLTGRPPFDGDAGELIAAHLREPPPLASSRIPDLPGIVDQVFQQCLRKSPSERFPSMAELVQAVEFAEQLLYGPSAEVAAGGPSGALLRSGHGSLPGPRWANPIHAVRTTLNGATGQLPVRIPCRSPRRVWIAGLVGALAVVGAVVGVTVHGAGGASSLATQPAMAAGSSTAQPPTQRIVLDAMPMTARLEDPIAADPVGTTATVAADAGVAGAASAVNAGDAAAPPPHPAKKVGKGTRPPSPGGDHANPNGSATKPHPDDRTD